MVDVVTNKVALDIKIDPDAFTIGDMALIMGANESSQAEIMPKLIDMMNRVVVGGVNHIPARRLGDVVAEVVKQWGEVANPKASAA